jgi:hypothetical protein
MGTALRSAVILWADPLRSPAPLFGQPTYKQAVEIVGGYIQLIDLRNGRTLVVDEEGLLKGYPTNERATELTRGIALVDRERGVVGNVILLTGWKGVK